MYSPEFMKFLIGHDIEEFTGNEKDGKKPVNAEKNIFENKIFRYAKYATIPVEIKD